MSSPTGGLPCQASVAERPVALPPGVGKRGMVAVLPVFEHASFDPETTHLMGEVFDRICQMPVAQAMPKVAKEVIANRIIGAAHNGERDPDRLRAIGLQGTSLTLI